MVLTVYLLIAFNGYSLVNNPDTGKVYCVPEQRALELIAIELKYEKSLAVDSQQVKQISNLQTQLDFSEQKVAECLIAQDELRRAKQFAVEEIEKKDNKIEDQDKEIKNSKLINKLAVPGAIVSFLLNLAQYALK